MRAAVLQAATHQYGAASAEVAAVKNAYAAINVGAPAAGAPPLPPTMSEVEPNDTWIAPQHIQFPVNPSKPFGGPDKLRVVGGGANMMTYTVHSQFLPNWFVAQRGLAISIAFAGAGVGHAGTSLRSHFNHDLTGVKSCCGCH
jgi:hypothetical protein